MSDESSLIKIDYFSDVLCIWAWVSQRRVDELMKEYHGKLELSYRFVNVFGDAVTKLTRLWDGRGGLDGYQRHIKDVAAQFELSVHEDVWKKTAPSSSLNAHLVVQAVSLCSDLNNVTEALRAIREAFFAHARDISDFDSLVDIVASLDVKPSDIRAQLANGAAAAQLMADYQLAETFRLRGSPSFVLNQGRQTLYGNVGYRILQANVEELINKPEADASWC